MCRLIGEYRLGGNFTNKKEFENLTSLSKKGGPDDTGFYINDKVQLGFNRLSILDLSQLGHQPMVSPDKRYVVVFNGEIYNHKQLRARLKKYNNFKGTSDTETLVNCFEEWGVYKTANQLDGMFAIAVYDNYEKRLVLLRDFAGIKPLFYGVNKNGVAFASQYNQITRHPWFSNASVNNQNLSLYLKMHYVPAPYGLHENTFQVLPGQMVIFKDSVVPEKKFFASLPFGKIGTYKVNDDALSYLDVNLNDSVKNQLEADVPLGAFLSGGVDSALICNYAVKNIKSRLNTFTIGSDSKKHDESEDAKKVADLLNANFNLDIMNSTLASEIIDDVFNILGEPLADYSIIPTYLVSKFAVKELTVALSGDGGDELFYGYERFESVIKNRNVVNSPYMTKYLLYGLDKVFFKNKHINSGVVYKSLAYAHQNLHSRFTNEDMKMVYPDYNGELFDSGFGVYDYENTKDIDSVLLNMRKAEFYGMMQKTLRKVDMASMGVGLEVRVPFLSKDFINAALDISPKLSYQYGRKKIMLKKLLSTQLPEINSGETKRGFTIPLRKWIQEDLKEYFFDTLNTQSLQQTYGFKNSGINKLLTDHINNNKDNKWALFTILSLFKWHQLNQK